MKGIVMIKKILKIFFPFFFKEEKSEPSYLRARDKSGKLKADNKKTPTINEAWVGGKAPPKKRGRPKKSKK